MQAKDILQSDLLDIVFDDRNKDYGAYELRTKYNKRIATALSITALLFLIVILSSFISKKEIPIEWEPDKIPFILTKVEDIKPPPPPFIPPQLIKVQEKVHVFLEMKPVEDILVDKSPPENKTFENKRIDNVAIDGFDLNTIIPSAPGVDKGFIPEKKAEVDDNTIFLSVEEEASVDFKAWKNHLGRYLEPVIEIAAEKGMPAGKFTINIRFLVEKDGSITDVSALSDPGYGLAEEAIKVVKKGPQWSPGKQNGRNVRSYHTQPITFLVPGY
ncbi:MAG: energy transducer TonB [Flavisolibacter sp.]